ncbi:hypothetical protein BDV95DRAFT_157942 [Massariosphaeria phaeospora]|uniref:Uncharacterized protein n=1 Tax=Massariosphaeria phaeospora TaxID=100035 RepID=A0A7C8I188_9PLEO|nr:hypothetical protein BDV95DRAFT_157942 [Massariosphaeria phaeospora]
MADTQNIYTKEKHRDSITVFAASLEFLSRNLIISSHLSASRTRPIIPHPPHHTSNILLPPPPAALPSSLPLTPTSPPPSCSPLTASSYRGGGLRTSSRSFLSKLSRLSSRLSRSSRRRSTLRRAVFRFCSWSVAKSSFFCLRESRLSFIF